MTDLKPSKPTKNQNMKKIFLLLALSGLVFSCTQTRSGVNSGALYTSWNDTISASVDNSVAVKKKGEACASRILWVVAIGDSSLEAAKKEGDIKKLAFADTNYMNVLFSVFERGCTVAKGE